MTNSKLVQYLNEGVKVKHYDAEKEYNCILEIHYWNKDEVVCDNDYVLPIQDVTPYLYPLSCLTESIPYDGRMVVPLVELAKVEGTYKGEDYKIEIGNNFISLSWSDIDGERNEFTFRLFDVSFACFIFKDECNDIYDIENVNNQLSLFQLLLKMRINIFPDDIESIDPRSESVNPYTI